MSLEKKLLEIVKGLQKLAKAREDKLVHPEHRKMFRDHKDKMNGEDPLASELTGQSGTSDIGIEIRRSDKKEPGAISHGYARVGEPEHHREKAAKRLRSQLDNIKSQPKPNLPKSEKGVHSALESKSGESQMGAQVKVANDSKKMGYSQSSIVSARGKAKQSALSNLKQLKSMPKPNLPKSEIITKNEDIVAGVKVPHELKQHSSAIPREHPHREIAAKFVSDVHRKNKSEGNRMAAKYLNIDESGNDIPAPTKESYSTVKSEKISVGPTIVSSPDMKDRDDHNSPATIQSPNVLTEHGIPLNNKEQAKRILRMAGKFKQSIGSKK